jgi:DNA-binding MarR family transcriptional regulator
LEYDHHEAMKLQNQLCFPLYAAARGVVGLYTPYLKPLGLTYTPYIVFLVLWEKDGQPVNDIAQRLLLETNTVTPLLQRMEKEGILSRKRGDHDKRQHIVHLTAKGKRLEKKAYELIPAAMGERLADCPLSLEEYQHLAQELDAIINSFKK